MDAVFHLLLQSAHLSCKQLKVTIPTTLGILTVTIKTVYMYEFVM